MNYNIYSEDGQTVKCVTDKLEYNGQFLGESSITFNVKSSYHIDFAIGDYILYRGEKYTFENVPTEKKVSEENVNGESFQYDNIKLSGRSIELSTADFNDFVGDAQSDISFTGQPNFSFVAATPLDLALRIQANMDRYYSGDKKWTIQMSPDYVVDEDHKNMLITVSNIFCWDALALFKSKYDINFIVRGRTVTIGTNGSVVGTTFKVGSYNGLYDMTRNVQSDQAIITRLSSYGNTTNINPRYYSLISAIVTAKTKSFIWGDAGGVKRLGIATDLESNCLYDTISAKVLNNQYTLPFTKGESIGTDNATGDARMCGLILDANSQISVTKSIYNEFMLAMNDDDISILPSGNYNINLSKFKISTNISVGGITNVSVTVKVFVKDMNSDNQAVIQTVTSPFGMGSALPITFTDTSFVVSKDIANPRFYILVTPHYISSTPNVNVSYTYEATTADNIQVIKTDRYTYYHIHTFTTEEASLYTEIANILQTANANGTIANYAPTTILSGVNKENITDLSHISYDPNSKLPNNMNVANLALPGFPTKTLAQWVDENKANYSWLQDYVNQGYTFSNEQFYPYVNSKNIGTLGIRPKTEYFTSEDATHKDIYPSLQYFSDNRNQIISVTNADGTPITDEGLFQNGQTPQQIKVTIHNLGFDFDEVKIGSTDPKLHMNSGYCGGKDFTIKGYSLDNIILTCDRVKDDSLGKYFPNVNSPLTNGDKFVITDIYMPTTYIEQASVELLKWNLKLLVKNDYTVYSYSLTPDNIFIKRLDDLVVDKTKTFHETIKEGDVLLIEDDNIGISGSITIDNIKITEGDGILPKYAITLKDTQTVGTFQKIQQQIDALTGGGGTSGYSSSQIGDISYASLKPKFLSKVEDDGTDYNLTVGKDLTVKGEANVNNFKTKGFIPQRYGSEIKNSGDAEFESITVRKTAFFRSITVSELKHIGGELALTPAAMICSKVEDNNDFYRCYFDTTDGKITVYQEFVIGDGARCQQFKYDNESNGYIRTKYYWRKVINVGEDYIDLSKSDYDTSIDNSIPSENDNIVQLGYFGNDENNNYRKSAIILSTVESDSPTQKMYQGINTYSLNNFLVKNEGYVDGVFHTDIFGNFFAGNPDDSSYVKYDITNGTQIKGKLSEGSTLADGTDINNLNVYKTNLILNSGFTGNYSTEKVAPDSNISDTEMYSDPLLHWQTDGTILDNEDSESGKAISLVNGSLSQIISYSLIIGEKYIFSFKASGTNINISIGGYTESIALTGVPTKYNIKFTCIDNTKGLDITISSCIFYEPQLILGVIIGDYQVSPGDSRKELSYFENIRYITDAIVNGNTSVLGGLIMSQIIKVGNYRDGSMINETGGMSGAYTTQNDPFIWGGGSLEKAIYTISKYKDNPAYQATDEEISHMSKFVVTHGGRAILTDMILRGYVYAVGGIFKSITSPNGAFKIDEVGNATLTGGKIGGFDISNNRIGANNDPASSINGMSLFDSMIIFNANNRQSVIGTWDALGTPILARFTDTEDAFLTKYGVSIDIRNKGADSVALDMGGGYTQGLCLKTHTSTQSETLNTYVHDVVVIGTSDVVITLPVMYPWYDGYVITITNLMTTNKVSIVPNHGYSYTYDSSSNSYTSNQINNFMIVDRGIKITTTEHYDLSNVSDCTTLVYHNDISNDNNIGAWVQHKHPRDW